MKTNKHKKSSLSLLIFPVLLAALLSSIGAKAAVTDKRSPLQIQMVSSVADTLGSSRRQGAVNVSNINWTCRGSQCSTSTISSAVAEPVSVCQGLAREVGAIRSFTVANRPLNSKELRQCNSVLPLTSGPSKKPAATEMGTRKASPSPKNWIEPDKPADKSPVFGEMRSELRKKDQAATAPAKTPVGAKGTPQPSAQGAGKASPPAPVVPFSPVAVRTSQLNLTGIGVAEISYRFTPVAVRTPQLNLTGIGVAEISYRFTPVAVRTPQLNLTGTGRSE
ncbi:MAG: CC_3452 family protein [Thermodesulfovibrionales bacterium]